MDGLTVVEGLDGWIVMTPEGGEALAMCPCCEKPFVDAGEAKRTADLVYPVARKR